MKLRELLRDVNVLAMNGDAEAEISAVTADSRLVKPGALFVAIPGTVMDGAKFIDQARSKGAIAVVSEPPATGHRPPATIEVTDARAALALIAANFYGRPAETLSLVGVTGTSGKTTTTKMIESIFDAHAQGSGEAVGLIGTIEYRAGDEVLSADRTTPDAVVLQEWFAKMRDAGVRHAVMEVSSHALALKRTYGIAFAAAVFTNLSRDHFDFHKDFEDYFSAKRILFDQIPSGRAAVVNRDDEYGRRLISELGDAVTFGMKDAGITPDVVVSIRGLHGVIHTPQGDVRIESQLLGQPNLYNWMGAIASRLADRVIVTSDNPRGEGPQAIIDEIVRGMSGGKYETIADRRAAIQTAIDRASDNQVIVIAGKGHEAYQVVGDRILHFDDKEEAELALKKRAHKAVPNSV